MKLLIKGYQKIRWVVMLFIILAFVFITYNTIIHQESLAMKIFVFVVAVIVIGVTLFYEYLKKKYTDLQKSLVTAHSIKETQALRDELVKLDKVNGMKDSIALFDVLFSLDKNQPEETLRLLDQNDKFFRSNLDMILVRRFSTFKAYTLINNRTQTKKAVQELYKLKETNLNQSKKMSLLYNWDQIEAMNLGYAQNDPRKALKVYQSMDTSKMNPRELLHLNVEIREMAHRIKDEGLITETNEVINSISIDSPFRGN